MSRPKPDFDIVHDLRSCLAIMRSTAEASMLSADAQACNGFFAIIEQVDRMNALLTNLSPP